MLVNVLILNNGIKTSDVTSRRVLNARGAFGQTSLTRRLTCLQLSFNAKKFFMKNEDRDTRQKFGILVRDRHSTPKPKRISKCSRVNKLSQKKQLNMHLTSTVHILSTISTPSFMSYIICLFSISGCSEQILWHVELTRETK